MIAGESTASGLKLMVVGLHEISPKVGYTAFNEVWPAYACLGIIGFRDTALKEFTGDVELAEGLTGDNHNTGTKW